MAGANFKVETQDLRKSSQVIKEKTEKYNSEWGKIYTEVNNLKIEWQGQSSEEFNKRLEDYRNDFQELATILNSYSEFLVKTADKIDKTENALKESAGKLFTGK